MKKYLSLFLAVLMILTALFTIVACNDPEQPDDPKDPVTEGGDKPPVVTPPTGGGEVERIPLNYLPTDGFNDAQFHILEWSCNNVVDVGMSWIPWEEGDVEEEDGDMLASAVFDRNAWVEETYGVIISKEYAQIEFEPTYTTRVRNDSETSSNTYQLFTMRTVGIVSLIEEGYFADMNEYEQYLRTDQPWWVQDAVESFALGSHLYVCASEMLLRDKGATAALFFNQVMTKDYTDLPNFFELAAEGEWTLEELIYASEIVSHSNDNDEEMNSAQDIWGCIGGDDPVYYLFNAAGYKFAHIDEDGYIAYDFGYDEDSITVVKSIFDDFLYTDWYMNSTTEGEFLEKDQDLFVDGVSLFKTGMVKDTTNRLKNMNDLYGILPYPKYTLDQGDYSSLVWEHHDSVLGIPEFAANKEMCAVILEALSWESYYSVYPLFYDTILLNRAAKDQESKEMLEIIFATRSYDPGLYWDGGSGLHGGEGLLRLSMKGTSDIASLWAMYKDRVEENIQEVNNWIADKE